MSVSPDKSGQFTGPLTIKPLTETEWLDFVRLFAEHGVQDGCWCMYWRTTRSSFHQQYGKGNKQAFRQLVQAGSIPGILAYSQGQPIGWCSVAPRHEFSALERSPILKRIDTAPVWSIVCLFITRPHRWQGVSELLILAAIQYARSHGAEIIEAYPIRSELSTRLPYECYMGIESTCTRLGFTLAARRSDRRLIMRYTIHADETQEPGSLPIEHA